MTEEKREYPRLKICVPVELRPEGAPSPIRGETSDLSLGGFYIQMMFTLEVGTQLDVTMQVGESTLIAAGEVVTCDRTVGNGIRFLRMLPEDLEELDRFLLAATLNENTAVTG
jgi:c-di-GMP-binding flagellar brake protein YcgR